MLSLQTAGAQTAGGQKAKTTKQIAITFDDLPLNGPRLSLKQTQEVTQRLLGKLQKEKVPAIGFVNENKLFVTSKEVNGRIALLQMWIDRGFDLGNHSYSHPNLADMPLADFEADVIRGEKICNKLLAAKGKRVKYFRFPFLSTGETQEKKKAFEGFLHQHDYINAPVTIDAGDWMFSAVYTKAKLKGDDKTAEKVAKAYLSFTEKMIGYYEAMAMDVEKRPIKQILLLHCNSLNADYFDALCKLFRNNKYKFITLSQALCDPVYKLPETYAGTEGLSWLKRWRYAQGKAMEMKPEPVIPKFVEDLYQNAHYDD